MCRNSMIGSDHFLDFALVAAPRSGTTWLFHALSEHPGIWIPRVKELDFFNYRESYLGNVRFEYRRGIRFYKDQFTGAPKDAVLGDMSNNYYLDPTTAFRIRKHFPNAKILMLLRHPAEVAYLAYLRVGQYTSREKTFEEGLKRRPQHINHGFYFRLLVPYFDLFPRDQILVLIHEHFFSDLNHGCNKVYEFLGVDSSFRPTVMNLRINPEREIRFRWLVSLNYLVGGFAKFSGLGSLPRSTKGINQLHSMRERIFFEWNLLRQPPPDLSNRTRRWLMDIYRPDIRRLEDLLGVSLDCWGS